MPSDLLIPEPPSEPLLLRWFRRQSHLLAEEQKEEQAQSKLLLSKTAPKTLEKHGLALLGLGVASIRIGVGAKLLVELERPSAHHSSPNFPPHSFRTGDLAAVLDNGADPQATNESGLLSGVVYRVNDTRITLVISDGKKGAGGGAKGLGSEGKEGGGNKRDVRSGDSNKVSGNDLDLPERIRLVKVANESTFDRLENTLDKLAKTLGVSFANGANAGGDTSAEDEPPTPSSSSSSGNATSLTRSLFGLTPPTWKNIDLPLPPFNPNLNTTQLDAIRHCLSADHFSLIHGPPGTGKTTAIVELIMQIVASNFGATEPNAPVRILVCGASNLAVDNILERLVGSPEHREVFKKKSIGVTRIGHPARVVANLQNSTLDAQCTTSSEAQLVKDISKEIEGIMSELKPSSNPAGNKSTRGQPKVRGNDRKKRWEEVRELRKEYRRRDRQVTCSVLDRAQVVLATCHTAGGKQLARREYDWVVIDEACQAVELGCWIPILKCREGGRVVLAGDHLQLPPTVKSNIGMSKKGKKKAVASKEKGAKVKSKDFEASKEVNNKQEEEEEASASDDADNIAERFSSIFLKDLPPRRLRPPRTLETTLFSRLLGLYGPGIKSLLSIQYRMNTSIMSFPNLSLYESKLTAHPSCADIRLTDLSNLHPLTDLEDEEEKELLSPVVFYDTSGCEFYETTPSPEEGLLLADSKSNTHEVELVVKHLEELFARGVVAGQVTVLTPYSAQVALLHSVIRSHRFSAPENGGGEVVNGEEIELGTIDSMQGREKDVVIISLVRSNAEQQVGFLAQKKRLNVAITRAKRQLVVVGDAETIGNAKDLPDDFLPKYMEWLDEEAVVHPVVASI
ncbi:related to HCS1-DNA helicase A [Ustilago bromivora]|uniref:DNA helicase n=1 Tax=Ustilago bromivora TaxID=307758 RepID=A0A1K0H304_9BASI|nr:related to HCS1-DNA helicase A [Ustilago bromivora]SYW78176.1 related to HCS1 - DNA helicase A [Ustilago bromivora]